jgi:hypothetical protein
MKVKQGIWYLRRDHYFFLIKRQAKTALGLVWFEKKNFDIFISDNFHPEEEFMQRSIEELNVEAATQINKETIRAIFKKENAGKVESLTWKLK